MLPQLHFDTVAVSIVLLAYIINQHEIGCGASIQMHQQPTQNEFLNIDLSQEKMEQLKIPKDQTLLVRLPSNSLLKYTAYKDVSILHFRVPPDTYTALFTFKAFEESKSTFQRKCKPRDVTLHLKASSYPVISPENITFPKNFLSADERFQIYDLDFQSNEVQQRIQVNGPQIGNWFAVTFNSWTDPNNDRIEQQGLTTSCDTLLLAEMSVSQFYPIIIIDGQWHNGTLTSRSNEHNVTTVNTNTNTHTSKGKAMDVQDVAASMSNPGPTIIPVALPGTKPKSSPNKNRNIRGSKSKSNSTISNDLIYKFYVPANIGVATARILIVRECIQCPAVEMHVQANAFPHPTVVWDRSGTESPYIHSTVFKPNQTGDIFFEFFVQQNSWHYMLLKFVNTSAKAKDKVSPSENKLLNELKISSTALPVQDLSAAHDGHQEQKYQQNPQDNRFRHQNNTDGMKMEKTGTDSQAIASYLIEYALQIEFHEADFEQTANKDITKDATRSFQKRTLDEKLSVGNISADESTDQRKPSKDSWQPTRFRDMEFYPLLRQTYREFFMFDYDLVPDVNGTVPTLLNLTAGTPAGFSFEIGEVFDIGGTLSFAVSMKHNHEIVDLKTLTSSTSGGERSGILVEKLIGRPIGSEGSILDEEKTLPRSNQTIIVCMHLGEPGKPTWPDKCRYGRKLLPASSIVNNTDLNTSSGLVHVPFPESGQWYVTMGLYCHGAETTAHVTIIESVKEFVKQHVDMLDQMKAPCACANGAAQFQACVNEHNCLDTMNETETLKVKECLMDSKCTHNYIEMTKKFEIHHKLAIEQHFAIDNCNTSVVFTISSSPCVAGRCGRFGRCYHYMSGGFVFSTCVCLKGYRGWDCMEDTQVPSSMSILVASLLLTVSNLLFFPSIYMAVRREYYTEAVVYFFAMFFSIFYHACDSGEDEYSFCLVKIGVLQFCDFYCGLLAIWVTLVAMSHIRTQFVSLLHMFGAILLAFGTELNKQSLWVFLAPSLTGICIISVSWGMRCHKSRKWFPAQKYLVVYMPLGAVLVMVGLICYAFLQTKQNYHIVHSVWHMVMALSILCLLPSRNSFIPKC